MLSDAWTRLVAACPTKGIPILPPWYKYLGSNDFAGKCTPVFNLEQDIPKVLLAVTEILLRLGGLAAVVFVIYGGFQYLTSQGEPDKAKAARTTIINAIVGLVIVTLATAIVNLIGQNL